MKVTLRSRIPAALRRFVAARNVCFSCSLSSSTLHALFECALEPALQAHYKVVHFAQECLRLKLHRANCFGRIGQAAHKQVQRLDRKSTRLNSSHVSISYA